MTVTQNRRHPAADTLVTNIVAAQGRQSFLSPTERARQIIDALDEAGVLRPSPNVDDIERLKRDLATLAEAVHRALPRDHDLDADVLEVRMRWEA